MERHADRILPVGIVILAAILIAAQSGGLYLTKIATLEHDYLHLPERWFDVLHEPRAVPAAVLPAGGAASAGTVGALTSRPQVHATSTSTGI